MESPHETLQRGDADRVRRRREPGADDEPAGEGPHVPFKEAFLFWLKLGFINFGGPSGQIALMHHELVERRRWISSDRFLHALNYCMLLPGPEAQQLATYIGWLLHRAVGGLAAGILFVLPGAILMLVLSWLYAVHGAVAWVQSVFYGLRAAVIAIVLAALIRIGSKALKGPWRIALAGAAFLAIFLFRVPFPAIVIAAGFAGFASRRIRPWGRGAWRRDEGAGAAGPHPQAGEHDGSPEEVQAGATRSEAHGESDRCAGGSSARGIRALPESVGAGGKQDAGGGAGDARCTGGGAARARDICDFEGDGRNTADGAADAPRSGDGSVEVRRSGETAAEASIGLSCVAPGAGAPGHAPSDSPAAAGDGPAFAPVRPTWRRSARVLAVGLAAWWIPLVAVAALFGTRHVLAQEGMFFSKAAMVTFGGAYAVLAYLNQAAVGQHGWLEADQMLDGLGLAETTPGPLIMVTQFVGFLGAYRHSGEMDPILAGTLGAAVATWATFAPCFLWIFLGAPLIENLRRNAALNAALSAITAAVVGVILSLAVWFGLHTLFAEVREVALAGMKIPVPDPRTLDLLALLIATVCFVGLKRFGWGIPSIVLGSAAAGWALRALSSALGL